MTGFDVYVKLARRRGVDQDAVTRNRLADLYIKRTVLGYIGMQIREAFKAGRDPGPIGSIAKLYGSLLAREVIRSRRGPGRPDGRGVGAATTPGPIAGRWRC